VEKPCLNRVDRSHFVVICKSAVDRVRNTLRALARAYTLEKENGHSAIADRIQESRIKVLGELRDLCDDTLKLISDVLLPHSEGHEAQVFFEKMKGDLYRYLAEHASEEETEKFNEEANKAYSKGLEIGVNLLFSDPVRLGTILNYAVFKYEHLNLVTEAIEMTRNAILKVNDDLEQISDQSKAETLSILNVMNSNLKNWEICEEEEDEEEERPQAETQNPIEKYE
jgi:hypothetical protein